MLFSVNGIVRVNSDNTAITSENKNDLLDIVFYVLKTTFGDHINKLCKTEKQKADELVNITPYMCLGKRKIDMKALPTFGYCPLVWMVLTKR